MKTPLLFLCHRIPYPPNKSDKIRSFHLWQQYSLQKRWPMNWFNRREGQLLLDFEPEVVCLLAGQLPLEVGEQACA